jgi:Chaperone of endosialidase
VTGNSADSNTIRVGKQGTHKSTFVGGIYGTSVSGNQVVVASNGKLGVAASSARFKQTIKPMDQTSEAILYLKPVTFRYKQEIDPDGTVQFGLVAEEVEKVSPDLVSRDEAGKPYTVRYDAVNAMLLNEFLKEHRKVQQLEEAIVNERQDFAVQFAEQQKQIKNLTSGLLEVNARLEAGTTTAPLVSTQP